MKTFLIVLAILGSVAQAEAIRGWECGYKPYKIGVRNGHKYDLVTSVNPDKEWAEIAAFNGCSDAQTNCYSVGCKQVSLMQGANGAWMKVGSNPQTWRASQVASSTSNETQALRKKLRRVPCDSLDFSFTCHVEE
jgi:hypothetical protein